MSTEVQNHDAWLETAALYVVDAMTAEERRAFESHLRGCAQCQAEVASL
ncbi:MAG TPA: zf-HC2 domain-containing protein, partial [Candidatus Limnocylindria bacterium]|nr:zf-HC2 domain-containing protein [Candidatus Limnocylindria bacterium]